MRYASLAAAVLLFAGCDPKPSGPTTTSTGSGGSSGAVSATSAVPEGTTTYYFGVKPTHTKVTFQSKNDVSDILGETSYLKGSATIDFKSGTGTCDLSVAAATLDSSYPDRDRAMRSPTWLDVAKHPTIEFKGEKATIVEKPNIWKIDGKLTLRGVTNDLSITAKVRPLPAAIGQKLGFGDGPCVKVETEFKVKLADYKIEIPPTAIATVQPEISIGIDIWGSTVKPAEMELPKISDDPVRVWKPKVLDEGIPGTIYVLGKKPQFSIMAAESVTDLEKITAQTNVVVGFVGIDAAKGAAKVRLAIPVEQITTKIKLRDEHLRGPGWLDSAQFKTIEFESTKATRKDDKTWVVEGDFTMHGVKKPLTVEVLLRDIPVEKIKKAGWGSTPGIAFSTKFSLKLSEYGVKIPDQAAAKVSDELKVAIELTGLEKE
jgi:polyisoprenoid-binding protein YceI